MLDVLKAAGRAVVKAGIEPWVGWIANDPAMCAKVAEAFALLDCEKGGCVTIEDLEARVRTPAFIAHHKELKHFYEEAQGQPFGTDVHREWLREQVSKMSADRLADVIASLPQQASSTPKSTFIAHAPDAAVKLVTEILNERLAGIGAAKMADDVLLRLIGLMGTGAKRSAGHAR